MAFRNTRATVRLVIGRRLPAEPGVTALMGSAGRRLVRSTARQNAGWSYTELNAVALRPAGPWAVRHA